MHADCNIGRRGMSATLQRLDEKMRHHHTRADAVWMGLAAPNVKRETYTRQLELAYGFEAPLEAAFAYTHGLSRIISLRERARSGLIAQDLLALGHTPAQLSNLPQCESIEPFVHIAEALGWLYVVERATLGFAGIEQSLLRHVPQLRGKTGYLAGAARRANARWQLFAQTVEASSEHFERIGAAAEVAFRTWTEWQVLDRPQIRSAG